MGSSTEQDLGLVDAVCSQDLIGLAKQWIHNNIKEATLERTANHVRMNPSSFSRKFKQETRVTFIQYLTDARMHYAKKILKNPLIKISEISYTVGYSDQQHFTRTFKKRVGMSPEEYRANFLQSK